MPNKRTAQLTLSAMFIAMAVIIPMLLHGIPNAGTLLLPMHFPVLLAGFFVDPFFALLVGLLSPVVSMLITGMPPMFPVLPFMMAELATYGFVASVLYRKLKLDRNISLVFSMVAGRLAATFAVWVLTSMFGAKLPAPWVFFSAAFTGSLAGIAIQLAAIPAILSVVGRGRK